MAQMPLTASAAVPRPVNWRSACCTVGFAQAAAMLGPALNFVESCARECLSSSSQMGAFECCIHTGSARMLLASSELHSLTFRPTSSSALAPSFA